MQVSLIPSMNLFHRSYSAVALLSRIMNDNTQADGLQNIYRFITLLVQYVPDRIN